MCETKHFPDLWNQSNNSRERRARDAKVLTAMGQMTQRLLQEA